MQPDALHQAPYCQVGDEVVPNPDEPNPGEPNPDQDEEAHDAWRASVEDVSRWAEELLSEDDGCEKEWLGGEVQAEDCRAARGALVVSIQTLTALLREVEVTADPTSATFESIAIACERVAASASEAGACGAIDADSALDICAAHTRMAEVARDVGWQLRRVDEAQGAQALPSLHLEQSERWESGGLPPTVSAGDPVIADPSVRDEALRRRVQTY